MVVLVNVPVSYRNLVGASVLMFVVTAVHAEGFLDTLKKP